MSPDAERLNQRLVMLTSCTAHFLMHLTTAIYLTLVLFIARDWSAHSYDQLLGLWVWGSLLIGLGAPAAGYLSDRWSERGMMVVFFLLTGLGCLAAGWVSGPDGLMLALCLLGLGGAIYHPVGIPWAMKHSARPGRANGIVGIFGALGIGVAALVAGALTDLGSWRLAFLVPGAVCLLCAMALTAACRSGRLVDRALDVVKPTPSSRNDRIRAFFALSATMLIGGIVFQSTQTAMPKLVEEEMARLTGWLSHLFGMEEAATAIGLLVTLVYVVASGSQLIGGAMADKGSPRRLYTLLLGIQAPLLLLAAVTGESLLLLVAVVMVFLSVMTIPVENLLLQRYTPAHRRGLLFGAKFILSFGAGPLATVLVADIHGGYGAVQPLFWGLAGIVCLSATAALFLPPSRPEASPAASGAPAPGVATAGALPA